ncbi:hypothetical protein X975_06373, partial [Stegodyphus mimosarum]
MHHLATGPTYTEHDLACSQKWSSGVRITWSQPIFDTLGSVILEQLLSDIVCCSISI